MKNQSSQSASVWMQRAMPSQPDLTSDTEAEVCIVGAGIAGMTTAYLLAQAGKSVIVLDDGAIGSGQTERTTAHLSNAIDARYYAIERLHGTSNSRIVAESHTAAIDTIEAIVAREGIDCAFERLDGYLFLPPGDPTELLDRELAAAHRAGLSGVERVERAPLASFDTGPCLRFPTQGQFHPLDYLLGLAHAFARDGGRLFRAHVDRVSGGIPARVHASGGPIVNAKAVVVATNTPINDLVATHTKQAAYLSYVIAAPVPHDSVFRALYWDTFDPYHYVRVHREVDHDLLIVGGEDHRSGQRNDAAERYARLETWARARFPQMGDVRYRWSGEVMEPIDGLAFIGRNPLDADNVFIATGDAGMGMTHGTIAGILITDLICGRANPWAAFYDPSRKTVRAAVKFAEEAVSTAWQYVDWLTPGDVSSVAELAPDSGAVIRHGLSKVAVYRDERGVVHEMSAVCPHLGCIVAWNSAERTWDCPCHGSRFDKYGSVLNGPAVSGLAEAKANAA